MSVHRPRFGTLRGVLLLLAGVALLLGVVMPLGTAAPGAPRPLASAVGASPAAGGSPSGTATSVAELGPAPSDVVVGTPFSLAWQALGPGGVRATSFSAATELTVVASANGSTLPTAANDSATGPLSRSPNGTFSIPASAWNNGMLDLTLNVTSAAPATVRLFGPELPSEPAPIAVPVNPDLDHVVLYDPSPQGNATSNDTLWLVRDRFGDPVPGAYLYVDFVTALAQRTTVVPVTWTSDGTTAAWVNYSLPANGTGTLRVTDGANATVLGPLVVAAPVVATVVPAPALSPLLVATIALLAVGAVVGMAVLVFGGRARPRVGAVEGEEDLRRLAEGRATVVELVRDAGPLGLAEIEAQWEPPPAPAALADWVASLVTDGTLTATLGEGGRARFSLAAPPPEEPKVTLDEEALAREIARRDAAVDDDGAPDGR